MFLWIAMCLTKGIIKRAVLIIWSSSCRHPYPELRHLYTYSAFARTNNFVRRWTAPMIETTCISGLQHQWRTTQEEHRWKRAGAIVHTGVSELQEASTCTRRSCSGGCNVMHQERKKDEHKIWSLLTNPNDTRLTTQKCTARGVYDGHVCLLCPPSVRE